MNELIKYIGIIAGAITGLTVICQFLKSVIEKGFKPIYKKIEDLDENQCKNFLVTFLTSLEEGQVIDEILKERAHEVYEHYVKDLNGNSYIHSRCENLSKKGVL